MEPQESQTGSRAKVGKELGVHEGGHACRGVPGRRMGTRTSRQATRANNHRSEHLDGHFGVWSK
eukprot:4554481-Alexandrium_andersonii.AAC.1